MPFPELPILDKWYRFSTPPPKWIDQYHAQSEALIPYKCLGFFHALTHNPYSPPSSHLPLAFTLLRQCGSLITWRTSETSCRRTTTMPMPHKQRHGLTPELYHVPLETTFRGVDHPLSTLETPIHQYLGIKYASVPARFRQSKLFRSYPLITDASKHGYAHIALYSINLLIRESISQADMPST